MECSDRIRSYIETACNSANESRMIFRHGACFFDQHGIVSTGFNHDSRCKFGKKIQPGTHAEILALSRLLSGSSPTKIRKVSLIIVRYPLGANSKPCYHCLEILRNTPRVKIKRIYYFGGDGKLCIENMRDLKSDYKTWWGTVSDKHFH